MGWTCNPSLSTNNVHPNSYSCPLNDMWRHLHAEACHRNHNELLFALSHDHSSFFIKSTKAAGGMGHPGSAWKLTLRLTASFRQIRLSPTLRRSRKKKKKTLPQQKYFAVPAARQLQLMHSATFKEEGNIHENLSLVRSVELGSAARLSDPLWPGSRLQVPSLRDETVTS